MFGMFFRGVRITWRLFRALPKSVQSLIAVGLVVLWVLVILGAYGLAGNMQNTASGGESGTPANSAPASPESSVGPVASAPATSIAPVGPPTPVPSQRVPGLARGCLGGVDPSAAALAAQQQAPLTPEGAAEFAASYVRWGMRYPHIGNPDDQGAKLWAKDATAKVHQAGHWPADMKQTSIYASLLSSRFKVTQFSDRAATVELNYTLVGVSATGTEKEDNATALQLEVVNGHWRVKDSLKPTTGVDELSATGQPFVGGC